MNPISKAVLKHVRSKRDAEDKKDPTYQSCTNKYGHQGHFHRDKESDRIVRCAGSGYYR